MPVAKKKEKAKPKPVVVAKEKPKPGGRREKKPEGPVPLLGHFFSHPLCLVMHWSDFQ